MNDGAYVFLFAAAAFLAFQLHKKLTGGDGIKHCMTCGTDATPSSAVKGSFLIEIILWACFIVPGLIYSVWRVSSRYQACPDCGSIAIVPNQSPAAIAHRKGLQQ